MQTTHPTRPNLRLALAPVVMLFVRCAGGISHNPAESVELGDVAVALDVACRFLERLARAA